MIFKIAGYQVEEYIFSIVSCPKSHPFLAVAKNLVAGLTFLIIFTTGSAGLCLTPPWSQETLEKSSDLIVEGAVGQPVTCLGLVAQNKCYDDLQFSVPITVRKVIKGSAKAGDTIKITFHYYDYGKSNCVGDQTAQLHSGDQGTYYLKKLADASFSPVHWSGAKVTIRGEGVLPKCPAGKAPNLTQAKSQSGSIGQAMMKADGTLVLDLRAEDSKGGVGDGRLVYPSSHPQYREILKHIGEIKPGETKPVPPWE